MILSIILLALTTLLPLTTAQFQFFEQMFSGGHQHQQPQQPQNVASDSEWYQQNYEAGTFFPSPSPPLPCHPPPQTPHPKLNPLPSANIPPPAHCSNYLCPSTLACVHFPHHCPCPFPAVEDKIELGAGSAICVSKGGYKAGEAARKVELARKGLL
ncbi:MAG: hypothetical protein Q9221_002654 [Calogaya cf. arnoldii]